MFSKDINNAIFQNQLMNLFFGFYVTFDDYDGDDDDDMMMMMMMMMMMKELFFEMFDQRKCF